MKAVLPVKYLTWLSPTRDVVLSAELTEATYSGGSIALGAAIAIVSAARDSILDCYTAFTGNINLQGQDWRVRRVEGIPEKLQAAVDIGCRRVVIPAENEHDVPVDLRSKLRMIFAANVQDALPQN